MFDKLIFIAVIVLTIILFGPIEEDLRDEREQIYLSEQFTLTIYVEKR